MNVKLLTSIILLITHAAFAQGTFTYTFDGDSSPMNVWATFQVGSQAVASGYLSTSNIISGYMLQGGNQWSIFSLRMPVNTITALPNDPYGTTQLAANYIYDEIDIYGGIMNNPYTHIVYWPWVGEPANYPRSAGKWNVTYSVPEPNTTSLLVIGAALLRLAKPLAQS